MIKKEKNGISFYQFENLAGIPEIRHGFFPRSGGVSPAPFQSLNVAFGVGDDPDCIEKNRRRISRCFGGQDLVFAKQVHGTSVLIYGDHGRKNPPGPSDASEIGDAMVTDMPGRNLAIQVADCQAVLLFDTAREVVANIHSGWRGSIQNIIGSTVFAMVSRFGSRPPDIIAGVGPSLGPCCAEFVNFKKEIPEMFWQYRDSKNRFDFWAMSTDQLCRAGVRSKHIELSGICTRCRTDLFFSYRGEKTTGRLAAVIGLR